MTPKTSLKTFELKVTLLGTNPVVWRKILLLAGYNFYQLHMAVQAAFGWDNCHLFQFGKNGLSDVDAIGVPNDDYSVRDARKVMLNHVMGEASKRLTYISITSAIIESNGPAPAVSPLAGIVCASKLESEILQSAGS